MDHQHIWFPYDDFEIWSIDYENSTGPLPRLTGAANWTEHAQTSSACQPPFGVYNYSNSHPVQFEGAVRLDRSSNVPNIARGHSATNQEIRESALPAYDTYWQPSDMALRGEYLQEQRLASSTSSAPSRVSAASTPSSTIMEHTPMSLDTHAAGQSATPARSHSMPSSQEGPVQLQYPYPSTAIQSTSHQGVNQPSSALHAIDEGFVKMSFPLQTADHLLKREALRSVMLSPWKLNGQFEPNASLLLQFMRLDAAEGRWYCSFWKDGKICGCSCKKKDHAKGHIRSHLDLLPYVCSDNCPTSGSGCGRRYPAIEPLQKHRKGKATCEDCGMSILPANLKRHSSACPGRAASGE